MLRGTYSNAPRRGSNRSYNNNNNGNNGDNLIKYRADVYVDYSVDSDYNVNKVDHFVYKYGDNVYVYKYVDNLNNNDNGNLKVCVKIAYFK